MNTIFVGGLPPDIDEAELAELCSPLADIKTMHIFRSKNESLPCYAFVRLANTQNIDDFIKRLNGVIIANYRLKVCMAGDKAGKGETDGQLDDHLNTTKYIKVRKPQDQSKRKRPRKIPGGHKGS